MSSIIVGSKACPVNDVVIAMEQCDASNQVAKKLIDLQIQLGFSADDIEEMANSQIHVESSQYIVLKTLEDWTAKNGKSATLESLMIAFRRLKEYKIAQQLDQIQKDLNAVHNKSESLTIIGSENSNEKCACVLVDDKLTKTDKLLSSKDLYHKSTQTSLNYKLFLSTNLTIEIRKSTLFVITAALVLLFLFCKLFMINF